MLTHRISADLQHAVSCWMRVVSQYRVFMLVSDDLPESLSWRRHDGDNNNEMISPSMHTPLCWWQDPCFFSDCGWRSFLSVYWLQGRSSFCPYLYSGFGLLIGLPGYRGALHFARIFILDLDLFHPGSMGMVARRVHVSPRTKRRHYSDFSHKCGNAGMVSDFCDPPRNVLMHDECINIY